LSRRIVRPDRPRADLYTLISANPKIHAESETDVMADLSPSSQTGEPPGAPRWVKVFAIIALIVVLLVVNVMVAGGGNHGPSRHMPSGDAGHQVPPSSLVAVQIPPENGRW
jgi:hypothetical protein